MPAMETPSTATVTSALPATTSTRGADTTTALWPDPEAAGPRKAGLVAGSVVASLVLLVGLAAIAWTQRAKIATYFRTSHCLPSFSHLRRPHPSTRDISKTVPTKGPHSERRTDIETANNFSVFEPVVPSFSELEGSTSFHPLPAEQSHTLSPVELPASPVSFSLWSSQQQNYQSVRISTAAPPVLPRATFVSLSRFTPTQRFGRLDNGDNWI
jgi:hypothetical protein